MPVSALQTMCGSNWQRLKPTPDGWIMGLTDLGFVARVDVEGVIGKIGFSARFPSALAVEQLSIGMRFDGVVAAYPTLRHLEDLTISGVTLRRFAALRPDGIEVEVRMRDGRVVAFDLARPTSAYPATRSH